MKFDTILVRYGEIALKSRQTQRKFLSKLIENMRAALKGDFVDYNNIKWERGRLFVESDDEGTLKALSKVFGITSISPVSSTLPEMQSISELSLAIAKKNIKKSDKFAIRARRAADLGFTSQDIKNKIGDLIRKQTKAKVDLKKPTKELFIEVRQNKAYVFTEKIKGPGGLPYGIEGKVLGLYSKDKGFEKALWMIAKRGCEVEIACKKSEKARAEKAAGNLREWITNIKIHIVKDEKELNKLINTIGAKAVVSGQVLNKKNLEKILELDKKLEVPVFRPLNLSVSLVFLAL